jgi:amidase
MAKGIDGHQFLRGLEWLNRERRALGAAIAPYDAILTPATAETAPPLGPYGMNITDMDLTTWLVHSEKTVQFSFLWNVVGAPAISLPLAMHSNGLPIGVQIAAKPSREDIVIALGADLERAMPWASRTPPLHASRL